jgi:ABC-type phosphate transport system permease subunit
MRFSGDKTAQYVFLAIACSAIASLLLIAVFIFKEGFPFILRYGPWRFSPRQTGVRRRAPSVLPQ